MDFGFVPEDPGGRFEALVGDAFGGRFTVNKGSTKMSINVEENA